MTFGAPSGSGSNGAKGNGTVSSNGKASAVSAGPNGKNKELAARQQKGAAQTNARKRRILGVRIQNSYNTVVCLSWTCYERACGSARVPREMGQCLADRDLNLQGRHAHSDAFKAY